MQHFVGHKQLKATEGNRFLATKSTGHPFHPTKARHNTNVQVCQQQELLQDTESDTRGGVKGPKANGLLLFSRSCLNLVKLRNEQKYVDVCVCKPIRLYTYIYIYTYSIRVKHMKSGGSTSPRGLARMGNKNQGDRLRWEAHAENRTGKGTPNPYLRGAAWLTTTV